MYLFQHNRRPPTPSPSLSQIEYSCSPPDTSENGRMMPHQLDYESPSRTLVRPWYLWFGAAVAIAWFLTLATPAVLLGHAVVNNRYDTTDMAWAVVATLVCFSISVLGLVMEWRALVRYSANDAAGVGMLLALFAVLAYLAAFLGVISRDAAPTDAVPSAVIATAFALAAFALIRWSMAILKWPESLPYDSGASSS